VSRCGQIVSNDQKHSATTTAREEATRYGDLANVPFDIVHVATLDLLILGTDNSVALERNHKEHSYEGRPRSISVCFAADI
jgi:hypothetical protein